MERARGPRAPVTPAELAAIGRRRLAAEGDRAVAATALSYFKDAAGIASHGVAAPTLRAIERDLFARTARQWTVAEAVAFCEALLPCAELETKGLGVLLLSRYARQGSLALLSRCRSWLARGWCANWAATDALSILVVARVLEREPAAMAALERWARDRSLWLRRAAAVSLTPLARRGEALDASYRVARRLLPDRHDLVHKATGWLLREAGRTDAGRLKRFLLDHGPAIPRTALRYAIERLPAGERRRLLEATREQARTPSGRARRAPSSPNKRPRRRSLSR